MLISDIIKAAIPDADEETCEYVLWGRTPFPVGAITARSLYCAADRLRRANSHERTLCDFCDNLATEGDTACSQCNDALKSMRNND